MIKEKQEKIRNIFHEAYRLDSKAIESKCKKAGIEVVHEKLDTDMWGTLADGLSYWANGCKVYVWDDRPEKPVPFDGPEITAGGPVDSAYILERCHAMGINGIEAWCESSGVTLTWTTLYDEWKEMWINDGFDFNNPDDVEIIDDMPDYKKLDDRDYMFDYLKVENCNPQIVDGHVIFGRSDGSEGLFVYEDISFEESLEKDKDK